MGLVAPRGTQTAHRLRLGRTVDRTALGVAQGQDQPGPRISPGAAGKDMGRTRNPSRSGQTRNLHQEILVPAQELQPSTWKSFGKDELYYVGVL